MDLEGLSKELDTFQNVAPDFDPAQLAYDELAEQVEELVLANYHAQTERLAEHFTIVAPLMILNIIDEDWRQHLFALDDLREGIGWRAYQGRDPLVEFRTESFRLFQMMLGRIEEQIVSYLVKPKLEISREQRPGFRPTAGLGALSYRHEEASALSGGGATGTATGVKRKPRKAEAKVGRNDPCPCGSGKKYKHCLGRLQ